MNDRLAPIPDEGDQEALVLPNVVRQHVEEAAALFVIRDVLVRTGNVILGDLARLDERLVSHFDGLAVAGRQACPSCEALLEVSYPGAVFASTVHAVTQRDLQWIARLFDVARSRSGAREMICAFGWLHKGQLLGIVANHLGAEEPVQRRVSIAACAEHRVDPGLTCDTLLKEEEPSIRALAIRTAGEIGRQDMAASCATTSGDEDSDCRFWSVWSGVMLGDRNRALNALTQMATIDGPHRSRAFTLGLQTVNARAAHAFLKGVAADPAQLRWLVHGSGIAGDPTYVPWLITHMREDKMARLAGESFTLITGADLSALTLDRPQPEGFEAGPTDDPDDDNVDMDPDDGLPWPDVDKIEKWWAANASRFQKGTRYFMGAPVTRAHCIDVLKNGYQRQRILAAHYLCLLEPGTPLFNTSAPAWRQQRLLARM